MLIHVKAVHYDFYQRRFGELVSAFPNAFSKRFPPLLAIGIHHELAARTAFSPEEISVLLRIWTNRIEYHAMGCSIGSRVDLDGNITGLISADHVQRHIFAHSKMSDQFVKQFSKHFNKVFGRPAFIAVPISQRKEIDFGTKEKGSDSGDCDGRSDCTCESCCTATRSNN